MKQVGFVLRLGAALVVPAVLIAGCGSGSGSAGGAPAPISAEQEAKTKEMLKDYPKINADMAKQRRAEAQAKK